MAELKTKPHDGDLEVYLDGIADEQQREDARQLVKLLGDVTEQPPVMWGSSIIGFGTYRYKYASGREADWLAIGFAPRKGKTTIYCMDGFSTHQDDLKELGQHTTAKSCLYIKRLSDVNMSVLKRILTRSYANMRAGKFQYE